MYQQALEAILKAMAAQPSARFAYADVRDWSSEFLEQLASAGILQVGTADTVVCDGCGQGCEEIVTYVDTEPGGRPSAFVVCRGRDDIGRVPVPLAHLRTWALRPEGLATWLARELHTRQAACPIVPQTLWRLGTTRLGNRYAHVFLLAGIDMLESSGVLQSLAQAQDGTPVLVLVPDEDLSAVATVDAVRYLALATVLRADAGGLSLDREALVDKLGKGRPRSTGKVIPFEAPGLHVWERLTIEFRDDETVVVTGGGRQEPLSFVEMGFGDGRSKHPRPDSLWRLLRQLACANGLLDWDRLGIVGVDQSVAPRRFSDLRKRLKAFFPGIAGEPIKPYSPKRGYETAFVARVSDEYRRRLLSQSDRAAR